VVDAFPAPGEHLCGLAWDGEHLWHSDAGTERIYCFTRDGTLVRELACPDVRTCLSWDGRHLWQVAGRPKRLRCLDAADGAIVRVVEIDSERACGIEIDHDAYWLTYEGEGRIELRSLEDNRVIRSFGAEPRIAGIALADGTLWYAADQLGVLVAVDPATGDERERRSVGGTPTGLTWDGERLWYADFAGRRIVALGI
jgi:hypothetical protein